MKLMKWTSKVGSMTQWIAWYDDEHILCLDYMEVGGIIDTYNVLDADDFDGMDGIIETEYPRDICILLLKFLFCCGFNGGDLGDIE